MEELHLTKKDFRIEWFSGQGAGGQHRNKHQNCCRIIHIESGLKAQGTEARERVSNQRMAFTRLAKLVISYYMPEAKKARINAKLTIRNYHAVRNEVHDKASRRPSPMRFRMAHKKENANEDPHMRRAAT